MCRFLRISGKIQNLFFTKRETELYLNEIWSEKEEWEKSATEADIKALGINSDVIEKKKHIHLSDFFEIFLEV